MTSPSDTATIVHENRHLIEDWDVNETEAMELVASVRCLHSFNHSLSMQACCTRGRLTRPGRSFTHLLTALSGRAVPMIARPSSP